MSSQDREGRPADESPRQRITIEDLVGLSRIGPVRPSPGGEFAVFTVAEADLEKSELRTQLHRVELEGEPGERALTHALGEVEEPQVSPDGKWVAFLTFRPQPGEDEEDDHDDDGEPRKQVFLLPVEGGEARRLTEAADPVLDFVWWPDSEGVAYLVEAPRPEGEKAWRRRRSERRDDPEPLHRDLRRVEIWRQPLEGKAERLLSGDPGISEVAVSPDGKRLAYATNHTGVPSDDPKTEVLVHDLETGEARSLSGGRGGGEGSPRWSPDGRWVSFEAPSDPAFSFSREEVFVADPEGREPARAVTAAADRTVEEHLWAPDGTVLAVVSHRMGSRLIRADLDGRVSEVVGEGRVLTGLGVATGSGRIAFVSEDHASAPEVWACEAEGTSLRAATELNGQSRDWLLAGREIVSWENEGMSHEGILLLPPEPREPGPPPLLVIVHGGPHWHALDRLQHLEAQAWAAEGWAVFLPNYRGSCGWGDAYGRASYRDLGGADFRDLQAGVEAVLARGVADPRRVAITGASYGGYLTSWALAHSDRFRAGVSLFGIYSLFSDFDNSEWPAWERDYLGAYYWEDPSLYVERSVSTHVKELRAPLLLLHGEEDENTYITNSRGLYRALREMGRETEMVVYPREEHGLREPSHRVDAFRRSLAWMERHVLGRGEATRVLEAREVAHEERPGVLLRLVSAETCADLSGLRAEEGTCWLVVEGYLRAEGEVESLSLVPAGARPELLLLDEEGRPHRPVGLPLEVLGQRLLLEGESGRLRAVRGKDGSPPSLAFAGVFRVPARAARWRLRVNGYPALPFDVAPPKEEDEEGEG